MVTSDWRERVNRVGQVARVHFLREQWWPTRICEMDAAVWGYHSPEDNGIYSAIS